MSDTTTGPGSGAGPTTPARDHPLSLRRWETARREGASVDAGYSRREYALTLCIGGRIVTLAACRFDRPTTVIGRVMVARS